MDFFGKKISSKHLMKLWKKHFKDKPMPWIKAINFTEEEFLKVFHYTNKSLSLQKRRQKMIKEYGKLVPESLIMASVTKITRDSSGEQFYLIIRRVDSKDSEDNDLLHELKHIYNGDCE